MLTYLSVYCYFNLLKVEPCSDKRKKLIVDFELCGFCWLHCNEEFRARGFRIIRIAQLRQEQKTRGPGRGREGGALIQYSDV